MRSTALALAALLPCTLTAQGPSDGSMDPNDDRTVQEILRTRVETGAGEGAVMIIRDERIHAAVELPRFYERRGFLPVWVDEAGPNAAADSLLAALDQADLDGLDSRDYHVGRIREIVGDRRVPRPADTVIHRTRLADLDLLLTDAFLLYGAHLVGGVVNPLTIHPEWTALRREADLVALLESALQSGRIGAELASLRPSHPAYGRLRGALARYRAIAADGGWPEVDGGTQRPGSSGPAVSALRQRLHLAGDLSAEHASGDQFDDAVAAAVRRFQRRHGLREDGIVGLETLAVLNVPVEERIRTVLVNLERWRWLPRELGARHVLVNIAAFELDVVEGGTTVHTARVMVGQQYRKTPVFSDNMTYLVLSPTWTIPPNILEQDKLPLIRNDPTAYLRASRIRLLAPDNREVDPATVDWPAVTAKTRMRFRMDPGPGNPLGQVKFMFPNAHHVYLHDTPSRELFDRTSRAFSSGCIRVERPLELAALLLRGDSRWPPDRIARVAAAGVETTVTLPRPVPIHILYWTAWAESDGTIHFRPDVYDRDGPVDDALRLPPPLAARDVRVGAAGRS